jgi:hypothetical protein
MVGENMIDWKKMAARLSIALVALSFCCLHEVKAATVVDINSFYDYNVDNAVTLELSAGTYMLSPIGISSGGDYDAWNPWGSPQEGITVECNDPNGCDRVYPTNYHEGWLNSYQVTSQYITAVHVDGTLINPVEIEPAIGTPAFFANFFVKSATESYFRVEDGKYYGAPEHALNHAQTAVFTLSQADEVAFSFWDTTYIDNLGGISLKITTVPIPAAAWFLGSGLIGLALIRRKQKS